MPRRPTLATVLRTLRAHYGPPPTPVSRDPFHLILWEQVGYLATDATRRAAYDTLKQRVGLRPADILKAPLPRLRAVARLGGSIAAGERAARMRRSAELVRKRWDGDLRRVLRLPLTQARRALAAFPMIGEPGADRILATSGQARLVPLDSNALRVVQRLGLAPTGKDYRHSYQAAQKALRRSVPRTRPQRIAAYALLRRHGQELCRNRAPHCPKCPLLPICPTGRKRQ